MGNDGKEYESFVANLQKAILQSEPYCAQKNIVIEKNKKIIDYCGIAREFDLYWEYEFGGLTYKTVIECKDYNKFVGVEKIDALIGKLHDMPDLRPVFATKKGYQTGAQAKAHHHKIELLIVREQDDRDWHDQDGNPSIKKVIIGMKMTHPAQIIKFDPVLDGKWARENNINTAHPLTISGLSNEIYIEDNDKKEKYTLYDLGYRLTKPDNEPPGNYALHLEFADGYIGCNDTRIKMISCDIEYVILGSFIHRVEVDFTKELAGVVEYLTKGFKKVIFTDGKIKEMPI